MRGVNRGAVWGSLFLAVTYLVWFTAQASSGPDYLAPEGFTLFMAFLLYSQLVLYPIWIDHVDPSVDVVGSLRWLYPAAPALLLPLGLLSVIGLSEGGIVLPRMVIFLSALDLIIFFGNFAHFTESDSPFLDSLLGGFSLTTLGLFSYLGLPAAINGGIPLTSPPTLVMILLGAIFGFTLSLVLTGNAYIDSLIFSFFAVLLSWVLFKGALLAAEFPNPFIDAKTFLVIALALSFSLRIWLYGRCGR